MTRTTRYYFIGMIVLALIVLVSWRILHRPGLTAPGPDAAHDRPHVVLDHTDRLLDDLRDGLASAAAARRSLEQLVEAHPGTPLAGEAYLKLAEIEDNLGNREDAEEYLWKALAIFSTDDRVAPALLLDLGLRAAAGEGGSGRSLKLFGLAGTLFPESPLAVEAAVRQARILEKTERSEEALIVLLEAVEQSPSSPLSDDALSFARRLFPRLPEDPDTRTSIETRLARSEAVRHRSPVVDDTRNQSTEDRHETE